MVQCAEWPAPALVVRSRHAHARWPARAREATLVVGRGRGAGAARRHRRGLAVPRRAGSRRTRDQAERPADHARHDARRSARQLRLRRGGDAEPRSACGGGRPLRAGAVAGAADAAGARQPDDRPPAVHPRRAQQRPLHARRGRADARGRVRRRGLRHRGVRQLVRARPSVRAGARVRALRRCAGRGAGGRMPRRSSSSAAAIARWPRPSAWLRRARRARPPSPSSCGSTSTTRTIRTSPPSPFREQFAGRPYDGEIAFDDALVGALLAASGLSGASPTLVVVAGDHGESLGEHGESTHGLFVYEGALRVPLIIAGPGIAAGGGERAGGPDRRRADDCSTLPALAALAGAEGRSLRAADDRRRGRRRGAACLCRDLLPAVLHGLGAAAVDARRAAGSSSTRRSRSSTTCRPIPPSSANLMRAGTRRRHRPAAGAGCQHAAPARAWRRRRSATRRASGWRRSAT